MSEVTVTTDDMQATNDWYKRPTTPFLDRKDSEALDKAFATHRDRSAAEAVRAERERIVKMLENLRNSMANGRVFIACGVDDAINLITDTPAKDATQ